MEMLYEIEKKIITPVQNFHSYDIITLGPT